MDGEFSCCRTGAVFEEDSEVFALRAGIQLLLETALEGWVLSLSFTLSWMGLGWVWKGEAALTLHEHRWGSGGVSPAPGEASSG